MITYNILKDKTPRVLVIEIAGSEITESRIVGVILQLEGDLEPIITKYDYLILNLNDQTLATQTVGSVMRNFVNSVAGYLETVKETKNKSVKFIIVNKYDKTHKALDLLGIESLHDHYPDMETAIEKINPD